MTDNISGQTMHRGRGGIQVLKGIGVSMYRRLPLLSCGIRSLRNQRQFLNT